MPRVLIGCERSGVVRRAFRARGFEAWSCDLLPSEDDSSFHLQTDVLTVLDQGWSLAIFHPDCTYLTCSAEWAYGDGPYHQQVKSGTLVGAARRQARLEAIEFVHRLLDSPIDHIALENPVGALSRAIRKPEQIIQPWQFGADASKATCLWLKNLPMLGLTKIIEPRVVEWPAGSGKMCRRWANQTDSGQNKLTPGDNRWMDRARTYEGVAEAMVATWGDFIVKP